MSLESQNEPKSSIIEYPEIMYQFQDAISAPRPPSPPVRRFTATNSEKDFALEYGLPSSHTINTICLSG